MELGGTDASNAALRSSAESSESGSLLVIVVLCTTCRALNLKLEGVQNFENPPERGVKY